MSRHLGWLHSVPEESEQTRGQTLEENDGRLEMPKASGYGHLFDMMCDAGWCSMGPSSLGYTELKSWSECSGLSLSGWEFETLSRMSDAYVGMLIKGRKKDCLPPFSGSGIEQARKRTQSQFKAMFDRYRSNANG